MRPAFLPAGLHGGYSAGRFTFTSMYYTHVQPGKVQLSSAHCTAEIWPLQGALLNSWQVTLNGQSHALIEGYDDANDFARHAETKGFRSCKLSPYVCRLRQARYQYRQQQYRIGKYMLGDSAIHGLLYDVPFDVILQEANDHLAMVVLRHEYAGTDAGFPFAYRITVTYTLSQQNRLTLTTEVTNLHHEPMPIADGWHPYFQLDAPVDELQLWFASDTTLQFDEGLLPTGVLEADLRFTQFHPLQGVQLDNCFLLQDSMDEPVCQLRNAASGLTLSIFAHDHYPYLQVYTPPHRRSIAIENLSAAPDAFNNRMGLIELEPGEQIRFSASYEASVLP